MNEIFYQFKGKKMTLTHLFKAQAIFAWLWAVMFWLAPQMAVQGPGWDSDARHDIFWTGVCNPINSTWSICLECTSLGW